MKIKEIIVVEGRDDTAKIKSAVDADTIETNGSAIGKTSSNGFGSPRKRAGLLF